jgi:ABC-type polysaccharide/polyol phosphate transport system ATPase subunit
LWQSAIEENGKNACLRLMSLFVQSNRGACLVSARSSVCDVCCTEIFILRRESQPSFEEQDIVVAKYQEKVRAFGQKSTHR